MAEDDSEAPSRLAAWYDETGNWSPPSPGSNIWREGMPAEGDAVQHFGRDWVNRRHIVSVPRDLAAHIGSPEAVFYVDIHALNQVVPGFKHENAYPYVNNLDEVLANATHWSVSRKRVRAEQRLEVYRTLPDGQAVIVILGYDEEVRTSRVVSVYVLRSTTVQNRLKKGRMKER